MKNKIAAVVVSSELAGYKKYLMYIKPYLEHFGIPYVEVDCGSIPDCALIIAAQEGIKLSDAAIRAVKAGTGLLAFYPDALGDEYLSDGKTGEASEISFADCDHFISQLHDSGEKIKLYSSLEINAKSLDGGHTLVCAGDISLIETGKIGEGNVVLWRDTSWISAKVLGPVHGMDDLVWRSAVWAAEKPFVMQGMPPMLGMRIDDVWGAWRKEYPDNPLYWVDIANKYGIKPWLGLFQDNMDEATIAKTRQLVKDGKASAFPHAFAGCEWVGSDIPEHWAFYDHNARKPYTDEVMAQNYEKIVKWYGENEIPICKTALGHWYEVGANAISHILNLGCEFIGIHMQPSNSFDKETPWLNCGPYRYYETDETNCPHPVYYGDYLQVDAAPEYSGKLFNCVTEIRDVSGYEWHPNNDVDETVRRGIIHIRRAFDSMVPAFFFTHESCFIQQMNAKSWEESLSRITDAVKEYQPAYMHMDDICGYARAQHDIRITDAKVSEDGIEIALSGENDRETMCFVFTENVSGGIDKNLAKLPAVSGNISVML